MPMLEKMGYDDICPTCGSALIDGDQVTDETCIYCKEILNANSPHLLPDGRATSGSSDPALYTTPACFPSGRRVASGGTILPSPRTSQILAEAIRNQDPVRLALDFAAGAALAAIFAGGAVLAMLIGMP